MGSVHIGKKGGRYVISRGGEKRYLKLGESPGVADEREQQVKPGASALPEQSAGDFLRKLRAGWAKIPPIVQSGGIPLGDLNGKRRRAAMAKRLLAGKKSE